MMWLTALFYALLMTGAHLAAWHFGGKAGRRKAEQWIDRQREK